MEALFKWKVSLEFRWSKVLATAEVQSYDDVDYDASWKIQFLRKANGWVFITIQNGINTHDSISGADIGSDHK